VCETQVPEVEVGTCRVWVEERVEEVVVDTCWGFVWEVVV
jgi:hypothetical protein